MRCGGTIPRRHPKMRRQFENLSKNSWNCFRSPFCSVRGRLIKDGLDHLSDGPALLFCLPFTMHTLNPVGPDPAGNSVTPFRTIPHAGSKVLSVPSPPRAAPSYDDAKGYSSHSCLLRRSGYALVLLHAIFRLSVTCCGVARWSGKLSDPPASPDCCA